ncbi:MAG TPA: CPBP family intramembrane glutamic endopeptidase, partial [Caulobacteraceae bacterium]|nr:CPBP family intramembrane glutamic endopeptidase [Caulobacteraceae bacterium]
MTDEAPAQPEPSKKWLLSALCLSGGVLPVAARWLPGDFLRLSYGLLIAFIFLIAAALLGKSVNLRRLRLLLLAIFTFSLIQILNNFLPGYALTHILHETATAGNPLASTLSASVVIQLLETSIALIPIFILNRASGEHPGAIYAQKGKIGRWVIFAILAFLVFYLITFRVTARHWFPINGSMTVGRYLSLTPPLLLMVLTNGLQEEFLFRALFLRKYTALLGPHTANLIQAIVFTIAHVGVTYTPNALLFLIVFVFPLGLFMGYLMRRTDSVIAPVIFH